MPRAELRDIVRLAVPVIVAELGWMLMGVVDTIMAGRIGPDAIAAISLGNTTYDPLAFAAIGLLLGLDTVVSQAYGAGARHECHRWLWQALYLGAMLSPPMMLAMVSAPHLMREAGVDPSVLALAIPYVHALAWSLWPLLVYAAFRRYLQGMSVVRPVMLAVVSANVLNAVGDWLLLGPFGVAGIAWSTVVARTYMAALLITVAVLRDRDVLADVPRPDVRRLRRLLALGLPAGAQILLEIGVFATATVLVGTLGARALAAHTIALNLAATTFMVPLGISSAGAVAVGQAIGRGDPRAARRAGWLALGLGTGFMAAAAVVFFTVPDVLIRIFTTDDGVLAIGVPLMLVAALWQTSDGIQVVATGALRGSGNTRTPMLANLAAHWLVGLPAGWLLCFRAGLGVTGLWLGLSLGLTVVAVALLVAWWRTTLDVAPSPALGTRRAAA
jgi:MATE family, multidrug efflux pump